MKKKTNNNLNEEFPIVFIEWQDACSEAGWKVKDRSDTSLITIKSIGWLMEEHDDRYVLSTGYEIPPEGSEGRKMLGYFAVPKGWVKKIYEIQV